MPLWKLITLSFLIAVVIFTIAIFIGDITIVAAKSRLTWPTEVDLTTEPWLGSSAPVMAWNPANQVAKCKTDGNVTADVGQFETMEGAQRELAKLRGYLVDCDRDFCKGLAERISVQKVGWPGDPEHSTYFLTVDRIDEPTFYALCNYMWNTDGAWARQTYHRCTDFDHRDN